MSNLLLDHDDLSHLQTLPVNRSHLINNLYIQAQETIAAGDKVLLFHREDGRLVEDEIITTRAELDGFIGRHFPAYVEETNAIVDAIRRKSEGRTN